MVECDRKNYSLSGVDDIRKFESILNEEDRYVVSHNVPIPLLGIELDRKATHVAYGVGTSARSQYSRKANENWS